MRWKSTKSPNQRKIRRQQIDQLYFLRNIKKSLEQKRRQMNNNMEEFNKKINTQNQTFQVHKTNTNLLPLNRRSNQPNNNGTSKIFFQLPQNCSFSSINSFNISDLSILLNLKDFPIQNEDQRNTFLVNIQHHNDKQSQQPQQRFIFPKQNAPQQGVSQEIQQKNNQQNQIFGNQVNMNLNQKFQNYNNFQDNKYSSMTPSNFMNNSNNNTNINSNNNNNNFLMQRNDFLTKTYLNKPTPTDLQIPFNMNQQQFMNKQTSVQNIQNTFQIEAQNNSPKRQQQHIQELQQENQILKKELQKYREKDEKTFNLYQENKKLQDRVKELEAKLQDFESKEQQRRIQEQQKQQRRQRQREEMEIQRQYAYMLALEQIEQDNQNQNQAPNVDNMTYEDQIGYVSRGMKPEDINKIKEIRYDKLRMKDQSSMCTICQCDFENSEKLKELNPCQHFYHSDCINSWLQNEKNCPVCKQIISV